MISEKDSFYAEAKRYWSKRNNTSGVTGYCPCCGEPHYIGKKIKHDPECIWYDNEDDK